MSNTATFKDMNISDEILRAIEDMGFTEPTPIQSQTIQKLKDGNDIIGQAQTGTGKTAAFAIPCIETIDPEDSKLQAVILSPTRELAIQICEQFRKLLKYKEGIKVLPVYGGQPIDKQINALRKGVQIVVGTPGRIQDHMKRHTLKMKTVRLAVLDEADEMLNMGFREDIEKILSKIPEERQTALFSATMADDVKKLAHKYLKEPEYIKVASKTLTVASIEQKYYEVKEKTKPDAATRLIDMYNPELTVVFCNTKKRAAEVCAELQKRGYKADALHGDLKQHQRDAVMNKFRNRSIDILVATDVAARGIDVDNVDLVINYDLPQEYEYYVHRIGRTGRAGKSGLALSLVVGKQLRLLKEIMQYTKKKIKLGSLPSVTDVEQYRTAEFLKTVQATIEGGKLEKYKNAIQGITNDEITTEDIAAALLKMAISNNTSEEDETDDIDDLDYDAQSDRRYVKVSITVGKSKGIRIKDIVGALAGECGIPGREFGDIEVFDEFTLAEVPKRYYKDVIKGMKGKKIRGNKVIVSKSKL